MRCFRGISPLAAATETTCPPRSEVSNPIFSAGRHQRLLRTIGIRISRKSAPSGTSKNGSTNRRPPPARGINSLLAGSFFLFFFFLFFSFFLSVKIHAARVAGPVNLHRQAARGNPSFSRPFSLTLRGRFLASSDGPSFLEKTTLPASSLLAETAWRFKKKTFQ